MKKITSTGWLLMTALVIFALNACKKETTVVTPPVVAHFLNQTQGSYFITGPSVTYKVPIGLTTVSDRPRTINVEITSPTGAQQGTQYNVSTKSITIPAGKVVDTITINGVFAQYQAGRRDTLVLRIQNGDVAASQYNNTFRLFMRGPCFQGEVATDLQALLGNYNNTTETLGTGAPYGPYRTVVKSATLTSPTTANIVIGNIYDDNPDWNDLTFTLDWTDINDRKITLQTQNAGGNAGNTFGASFAGQPHGVRPVPASAGGQVGTFDFCNQVLTLRMQIGIFGVGYSSSLYTVTMRR